MPSLCSTAAAVSQQAQRPRCQFSASALRCAHSEQRGRRIVVFATAEDMAARARPFPFTRIAGQEEMKQALILNVVDPNIGGVLIMGDRGTGKSVAVRCYSSPLDCKLQSITTIMRECYVEKSSKAVPCLTHCSRCVFRILAQVAC